MLTVKARTEPKQREALAKSKPLVYSKVTKFDEKVANGESIALIQYQYRYDCNMRCRHCSIHTIQTQPNIHRRMMAPSDVKDMCDQAHNLGLARFEFNGGEPFVVAEYDKVIKAVGPERFYMNTVTNGWLLDRDRARYLRDVGIDRVQVAIDSLIPEEHDHFRRRPGAYDRARKAIEYSQNEGMDVFITTVVTRKRLYSTEFIEFLKYFNATGVGVFCTFAKPVGAWAGNYEIMVEPADLLYFQTLERSYRVFSHLTASHGINMGCLAVRGLIAVTPYGDVLPCQYIFVSVGNLFDEPLDAILKRGLSIPWIAKGTEICPIAQDREFVARYDEAIKNRELPIPLEAIWPR